MTSLRTDDRQWTIYDPHTIDMVFKALNAASLVMFGAWLERRAASLPASLASNIGTIGSVLGNIGESRQRINAGLAPNDVPDELVHSTRNWDTFVRWLHDPSAVPLSIVESAVDELAAAMAYLNERTNDTGTHHPSWNAQLVSDQCKCGR